MEQTEAAFDLRNKRVLIFVVAYNAERTLAAVLDRIPPALRNAGISVLVIDDSSKDETFHAGLAYEKSHADLHVTVLRTPVNQGYGGNQKLGYRYAIEHGYDVVALLHGDGQYAPEKLPDLLEPILVGEADAVFGSRMLDKGGALRGRMPLYKYVGNRILSTFQNTLLNTGLSEFHSGYRLYTTAGLAKIPFERNTNDFHFDTEIILQMTSAQLRICELPIPTYYGDEICHVDGLRYAWNVVKATLRWRLHGLNLFYDRRYDIRGRANYSLKLGYPSSHSEALAIAGSFSRALDLGCGPGLFARELATKGTHVTAVDCQIPEVETPGVTHRQWDLENGPPAMDTWDYDAVLMLDVIEHLHDPEEFMERLRETTGLKCPTLVLTTGNVAFFVTRLGLLLGQFNYGSKGILDRTHTRLFTFRTLRELLFQAGYEIEEMRGIPAPYPAAIGLNPISRCLLAMNGFLLWIWPEMFSYQILVRAKALPTVRCLLEQTVASRP